MSFPETHLPTTDAELAPLDDERWSARALSPRGPVVLHLPAGQVVALGRLDGEHVVEPSGDERDAVAGHGVLWALPADPRGPLPAWQVTADAAVRATRTAGGWTVVVDAAQATLTRHEARPRCDVHGDGYALDLPDGALLGEAFAGFYWGTMVPSVVERTRAAEFPDARGYVLSTLASTYAGTYPDVDHEFQIKGRLAWGGAFDQDVVRRMMELQLRMVREDPEGLYRDPCAVQPDGTREYHVRRSSLDGSANAVMFLVTGNIEIVESVWLYVARTGDVVWLRENLADLEGAFSLVEDLVDRHGRLWSDVYYEDQVIKDGRETMAAALAMRSSYLLAELERLLGRTVEADRYDALAQRLGEAIARPLPLGHWDPGHRRFVDWVDRSGRVHDHIHLLANVLPTLVGAAAPEQAAAVAELVEQERDEFQRFPTFMSARVGDYTDDEIGDGGPYDLCAAGRYWCWDAAYWHRRGDGPTLAGQLAAVARMGASQDWVMGERYDMDYAYYTDGTSWHGAAHYYEYPCVYSWVLVHEFLGLRPDLGADLLVAPRLAGPGAVRLDQAAYRLRYEVGDGAFTLENRADAARTFRLDLSAVLPGSAGLRVVRDGVTEPLEGDRVEVGAGRTVTVVPAGTEEPGR
ncbi:hypothetical protein [Cellulomonas sp. C5510]|uniref:hypothetical protein n=1 Tax=Cellulomonas sp. C5510 TaxID=2871170 RepID=UPI001C93D9E4|nr:hypothetical protein [Cellulomonas sp. C5510]QZN85399.1 hypothetical protein K5O09_16805 [Cellulomonas sp. C5510]